MYSVSRLCLYCPHATLWPCLYVLHRRWPNIRQKTSLQIFEYNGAAIVAMAGKECIAIGSDLRFGVQFQTLATDYKKVYKIHDKLYIGLAGLGTDAQTM